MKPAISIIVPVYNVESFLEECINSILVQSFKSLEVILVNDGSTDMSGKISDKFAQIDKRVKVIHKEYGGVSSARNIGVETAQGEFIGFVDSDDRIDKDMFKELYRLCRETVSDISICQLGREINGSLINKGQEPLILEMDHDEALRQLFKGNLFRFSLCNKLFKKNCFKNIQFPEGRIHEDLSTTYKLFANSKKAVFTNYIGYIYVKRENSILTSTFNKKRLDAFLGWDEILTFMRKAYSHLFDEIMTCYVYWAIDNVFYTLNQVRDRKERNLYLEKIQESIRKRYKYIIKAGSFPPLYRYYITLLFVNFRFFIFSYTIKTFLQKGK